MIKCLLPEFKFDGREIFHDHEIMAYVRHEVSSTVGVPSVRCVRLLIGVFA